jgi:hypothetical protein
VVILNEQGDYEPASRFVKNHISFTQQLEKLGFRRVEQGYQHSYFTRDIPEGLSYSIRRNDRRTLPSSSMHYLMISPSDVANLRTPSCISVPETSAGDGSVWSSASDIQSSSARQGAPSGSVSCGNNYRVVKRGSKPNAPHANRVG